MLYFFKSYKSSKKFWCDYQQNLLINTGNLLNEGASIQAASNS